ncbi:DUF2625 family protein [Auritidibacter ignavus]|uniref:DUF2625 family protein n=1 Tax=Auritidibacter ignavus TaxID=678932 RepID=A0AAJ6AIG4_9MICC|nr:DUF2625 family protein [Auritidibacter ignavus]WGH92884.1 DUF2625 family protein [Auritidibacter ignavus]
MIFFRRQKKSRGPQRHKRSLTIPEFSDTWPAIDELLSEHSERVHRVEADPARARQVLNELGVSEVSHMGALLTHTAGLLIDGGWLRILGSGNDELPDLTVWTPRHNGRPLYMTIAVDVIGGIYAIDGGGLGISTGYICYFDPVRLNWGPLAPDYAGFLNWVFSSGYEELYEDLRWEDHLQQVRTLDMTQGIRFDPPLHQSEGVDINTLQRETVELEDLWATEFVAARSQLPAPQREH